MQQYALRDAACDGSIALKAAIPVDTKFDRPDKAAGDLAELKPAAALAIGNRRIAPRWVWNAKSIKAVCKLRPTKWRLQTMNSDQIKGNWKQFVGKAKEKWGRLTDDDWKVVEGKRDQLVGKIQERYGIGREEAERQLRELERT